MHPTHIGPPPPSSLSPPVCPPFSTLQITAQVPTPHTQPVNKGALRAVFLQVRPTCHPHTTVPSHDWSESLFLGLTKIRPYEGRSQRAGVLHKHSVPQIYKPCSLRVGICISEPDDMFLRYLQRAQMSTDQFAEPNKQLPRCRWEKIMALAAAPEKNHQGFQLTTDSVSQ